MIRTRFYCPTCHTAMIAAVTLPAGKPPVRHLAIERLDGERIESKRCPGWDRNFPAPRREQFEEQLAKNW